MKKIAYQVLFEVEDDTDETELVNGLHAAIVQGFDLGPEEGCKISRVMYHTEPPPKDTAPG